MVAGVTWSVLFQQFPLANLERVTAAVSAVCGIPAFDAATKVRRGWGFLEWGIPETEARQAAERLDARGVATVVIDDDALRPVPDSQVMIGFEASEDGLLPRVSNPRVTGQRIPWAAVSIVAAGGFTEEVLQRESTGKTGRSGAARLAGLGVFLVTGIPVGLFGRRQEAPQPRKKTQLVTFAQIVTSGGESFFLNPEHFDFSGLGPLKQVNASLNFRVLLAELVRRSGAAINHGARFLLERKSLTLANYQSVGDFETELAWMLNRG